MKIIDLLNKIANDEEVPKEVEYNGLILHYNYELNDYCCDYEDDEGELHGEYLFTSSFDKNIAKNLNDTVEILEEEKKIPEKLKLQIHHSNLPNLTLHEEQLEKNDNTLVDCFEEVEKKFNEIIDYLKSKGE